MVMAGRLRKFKWCKRCDEWSEHLTKNSGVCIKCVEISQSNARKNMSKYRKHVKPLKIFCEKFGVKNYKDYEKIMEGEEKSI